MKDLNYQLSELCRDNRDGGFSTQATRSRILDLIANQLQELGFRRMQRKSLKPKHVDALINHWQDQGISVGTLKNRLSALSWWAKKINKSSIIARDNAVYGIGKRTCVAKESKAQELDETKLSKISDQHVRLSIRLQAAFGLRREESIKFSPSYAVKDDHIRLKPSWTKGGRARTVPIRDDEQRRTTGRDQGVRQRRFIDPGAIQLRAATQSLPATASQCGFVQAPRSAACLRPADATKNSLAGGHQLAGGPATKSLTNDQRALNLKARVTISRELGHNREEVSKVYLGR